MVMVTRRYRCTTVASLAFPSHSAQQQRLQGGYLFGPGGTGQGKSLSSHSLRPSDVGSSAASVTLRPLGVTKATDSMLLVSDLVRPLH